MQLTITTIGELDDLAEKVLELSSNRKKIFLQGDLGTGKTTFTQFFCKHFGVKEAVTSPTFSLVNEYFYLDENGKENFIHHLDLYRLKNLQEALDIGIEDYLYDENYCLIEWPEILEPIAPEGVLRIIFSLEADSSRKILIL